VDEVEAREGFDDEVEDGRAGIAGVVGVVEVAEEGGAGGVVEVGSEVFGEVLGGVIELEAGKDVKGQALAMRCEEMLDLGLGLGPVEELEDGALVELGVEENVGGCFGSEVGR